jgi:hypothetical protein
MYDTIVVGAGTSALTYLYFALKQKIIEGSTLVIGQDGLWQRAVRAGFGGHEMGQPEDILYPANAVRAPVPLPQGGPTAYKAASAIPSGSINYLQTGRYVAQEQALQKEVRSMGKIDFIRGTVTKVMPFMLKMYKVILKKEGKGVGEYIGKRVIVTSGGGPPQAPETAQIRVVNRDLLTKEEENKRGYKELIGGEDYAFTYTDFKALKKNQDTMGTTSHRRFASPALRRRPRGRWPRRSPTVPNNSSGWHGANSMTLTPWAATALSSSSPPSSASCYSAWSSLSPS